MNYQNDDGFYAEPFEKLSSFKKKFREFSRRWWQVTIIAAIILIAISVKACGQDVERGKTINAGREKKRSFYYVVCIKSDSGKTYSIKYNVHCWTCDARIPERWDIVKINNKVYIKPQL